MNKNIFLFILLALPMFITLQAMDVDGEDIDALIAGVQAMDIVYYELPEIESFIDLARYSKGLLSQYIEQDQQIPQNHFHHFMSEAQTLLEDYQRRHDQERVRWIAGLIGGLERRQRRGRPALIPRRLFPE